MLPAHQRKIIPLDGPALRDLVAYLQPFDSFLVHQHYFARASIVRLSKFLELPYTETLDALNLAIAKLRELYIRTV